MGLEHTVHDRQRRGFFVLVSLTSIVALCSVTNADPGNPLHLDVDRAVAASSGAAVIPQADDAEFLRRVTLDLTGLVPPGTRVREFMNDRVANKRAAQIQRLLEGPEHARHMQQVFDTWLMQRRRERHVPAEQWQAYLRDSFAGNQRWDRLVLEILGADGTEPHSRAAARFYLDRECKTDELVRDISSVFLGRNLHCAQCHDHPIVPAYKQAHYFGIAAFLDRSFLFDDKVRKQMVLAEKAEGETAFTSALTQVHGIMSPQIFEGPQVLEPVSEKDTAYVVPPSDGIRPIPRFSRRALLPAAIVAHPSFSRNIVNRLWALLFGRGIVEPVDQDHEDNPPLQPELLDLLSHRFIQMNYDIQALLRELTLTQLYGRSSNSSTVSQIEQTGRIAVLPLRKLTPEQLAWSWLQATGRWDAEWHSAMTDLQTADPKLIAILVASRSTQESMLHRRLAAEAAKVINAFVTSLPGEAPRSETTAQQALYVLNSDVLRQWIVPRPGNLLDRLMRETSDDQLAQELFLNVLSRLPLDEEVRWVQVTLADAGAERAMRISDLAEALLTSTEFRFNH